MVHLVLFPSLFLCCLFLVFFIKARYSNALCLLSFYFVQLLERFAVPSVIICSALPQPTSLHLFCVPTSHMLGVRRNNPTRWLATPICSHKTIINENRECRSYVQCLPVHTSWLHIKLLLALAYCLYWRSVAVILLTSHFITSIYTPVFLLFTQVFFIKNKKMWS